jgi:DNA gyrase subunit A
MDVVEKDGSLLVVTSGGYGKQTPLKEYTPRDAPPAVSPPSTRRRWGDRQDRRGACRSKGDDLTIITSNGVAIRIKNKDVKQAGRATKGVHLIKPQPGDSVASVARIAAQDLKKAGRRTRRNRRKGRTPAAVDPRFLALLMLNN